MVYSGISGTPSHGKFDVFHWSMLMAFIDNIRYLYRVLRTLGESYWVCEPLKNGRRTVPNPVLGSWVAVHSINYRCGLAREAIERVSGLGLQQFLHDSTAAR